uniref:Uncharacterized protein n=1 Tax=Rhizophora mucronata TaxID=61149 RepID=A0A2P2L9D7_RHIMU
MEDRMQFNQCKTVFKGFRGVGGLQTVVWQYRNNKGDSKFLVG